MPTSNIFDADFAICTPMDYDVYRLNASIQSRRKKTQKIILLEVNDGASVYTPQAIIRSPQVLGVLKITAWHTRGGNCKSPSSPQGLHRGYKLLELLTSGKTRLPPGTKGNMS